MNHVHARPSLPLRRHLLSPESLARGGDRRHAGPARRQGNGVRVHGIYFAAVSLAALLALMAAIALISPLR